MQWKRTLQGYGAKSGSCSAGIIRDGNEYYWQVNRDKGGSKGGIRSTLKEAKSAAEHAISHLNLLNK